MFRYLIIEVMYFLHLRANAIVGTTFSEKSFQMSGYVKIDDMHFFHFKAKVIVDCFLWSDVMPRVQVYIQCLQLDSKLINANDKSVSLNNTYSSIQKISSKYIVYRWDLG